MIPRQLGEAELHILGRQVARGAVVEMLQGARRLARLRAAYRELRAAARDGDVERGLDLPQVGVKRAAQPRKARVVERIQLDFDRLGTIQTGSPLSEWERAAVMRTST
jgi:hypothetical protein